MIHYSSVVKCMYSTGLVKFMISFMTEDRITDRRNRQYNIRSAFEMGYTTRMGAQWLSGRVLDSRPKGRGFEPHRRHCIVVLEQDTFILA